VRRWVVLGVALLTLATAAGAIALSNQPVGAVIEDSAGPGKGQLRHAASVSAVFGIEPDTALALHQDGVGWGALVKLLAIAEVKGVSIEQLLADIEKVDGEYVFDFGSMRGALTAAQQEELAGMPKGVGHLRHPQGMPPGLAKKLDNDGS
jgi:hypothetical protein